MTNFLIFVETKHRFVLEENFLSEDHLFLFFFQQGAEATLFFLWFFGGFLNRIFSFLQIPSFVGMTKQGSPSIEGEAER